MTALPLSPGSNFPSLPRSIEAGVNKAADKESGIYKLLTQHARTKVMECIDEQKPASDKREELQATAMRELTQQLDLSFDPQESFTKAIERVEELARRAAILAVTGKTPGSKSAA